jgi:hypothetical protein
MKKNTYYILKTNNPVFLGVPDGYDPDHFMSWVHPFTSMIAGPTGSGKSMFVRRFVHNIKHMMTPKPDRMLWCYENIISVLLHYSVSIAAAAAKAEYIPLLATAVYIPQSYSSVSGFYII